MATYPSMVITQKGQALYGKVQTGVTLQYTRFQIGSGQLANGQAPSALTALITPIDYFNINSISDSDGTANVRGIYQNTNLAASTYTCEIGLFAQDPDVGEILFSYANAGTQGDTIPPYADGPFSRQFSVSIAVENATSVTATIPSNTFVLASSVGADNGVASLDSGGQVPSSQLGNVPPIPVDIAKTDADNAFSVKQTFDAGLDIPSGQTATVEGTLETGTGGVINATQMNINGTNYPASQSADADTVAVRDPSGHLAGSIDDADSLGGVVAADYLRTDGGAPNPQTVTNAADFNQGWSVNIGTTNHLGYGAVKNNSETDLQWSAGVISPTNPQFNLSGLRYNGSGVWSSFIGFFYDGTNYSNALSLDYNGGSPSVSTYKNILDDGSGNATFAGTILNQHIEDTTAVGSVAVFSDATSYSVANDGSEHLCHTWTFTLSKPTRFLYFNNLRFNSGGGTYSNDSDFRIVVNGIQSPTWDGESLMETWEVDLGSAQTSITVQSYCLSNSTSTSNSMILNGVFDYTRLPIVSGSY